MALVNFKPIQKQTWRQHFNEFNEAVLRLCLYDTEEAQKVFSTFTVLQGNTKEGMFLYPNFAVSMNYK